MTELDIEIGKMSEVEAKSALKRLITTLSECMPCDFNDEIDTECPVKESCRKNSRPCDLAWLDFAKEKKVKWDKYGCPDRCPNCGNENLDCDNHQWVCYKCGMNFAQYNQRSEG